MDDMLFFVTAFYATQSKLEIEATVLSDDEIFEVCDSAVETVYRDDDDYQQTTINSVMVFLADEDMAIDFLDELIETIANSENDVNEVKVVRQRRKTDTLSVKKRRSRSDIMRLLNADPAFKSAKDRLMNIAKQRARAIASKEGIRTSLLNFTKLTVHA